MTALLERDLAPSGLRPSPWDVHRLLRYAALAVLFALVAWINGTNLAAFPIAFDDEGTYVAQAWAITQGDLAHYPYWYDHPPAGWILIAGWSWLTNGFSRAATAVAMGRELSFIATMVSAWLLYVLCRRIGVRWGWAAVAVAVYGFSPLAVEQHRMIFLDNLVTPWVLATFVLMRGKRSLGAYAAAGGCFAVAVLTKMTAGVFLPLVLWELWRSSHVQNRKYAITIMIGVFGLVGFMWPLMALMRGELLPGAGHTSLIEGLVFQLGGREGSGFLFDAGSDAFSTLRDWMAVDPWVLFAGLTATVPALIFRHTRLYAMVVVVHLLVILRGGYLPVPFIIQVMPYLALVIAGSLDGLWNVTMQMRHQRAPLRVARSTVAAGLIGAFVWVLVLPMASAWPSQLAVMRDQDANLGYRAATAWIDENIGHDELILVENQVWIDTVLDGRPRETTVWYYKLGLDPGVAEVFPGGYHDFDYLVSSVAMASTLRQAPGMGDAMDDSYPVVQFLDGRYQVEVRRLIDPATTGYIEDGLDLHYDHAGAMNLFGFDEPGRTSESPVATLPKPDEGGVLATWDGRDWLVDPVDEVRWYIVEGTGTDPEDFGREQYHASLGASTWEEGERLAQEEFEGQQGGDAAEPGGEGPATGESLGSATDDAAAPADGPSSGAQNDPRTDLPDQLQPGDTGADVLEWQNFLLEWDPDALPAFGADGVFGPETRVWTERWRLR